MAGEDVELRLSLKERQQVARGLQDTAGELEHVEEAAQDVGEAGKDAAAGLERASDKKFARGFAAIKASAKGLAGFVGRGLVKAARVGAVGLATLTVASGALSVKAIGLAGDARETASAFETVFGPAADRVGGRLDRLTDRFGLYNPELQDSARQFGVFAKAAGIPNKNLARFSLDLTKAGLDLASFYNTEPGQALEALRSGLSGEAEPLRKFGIFLSDAAMKAEAASIGLTGELTEQQKVMVRQRIIMKSLGDAQGDLARTAGGYANQQRAAQGQAKTFLTMLGGPLTTAATGAFRGFNTVAKVGIAELQSRLPGLERDAGALSRRFERWGNQLARELPGAIDTLSGKWDGLKGRFDSFSTGRTGDDLRGIRDDLRGLSPAIAAAKNELPGISDALHVMGTVTGFLSDHSETLAKWMPVLAAGYVALKVSQIAANSVAAMSPVFKVADFIATRNLTRALQQLAATQGIAATTSGVAAGAITGQTVATGGATIGQRLLNAAMKANPIGLVITAIALLVGGFVLLYKKSDTFRGMIDGLWNNILVPFGKFIGKVFVGYIKLMATMWLRLGIAGVRAFKSLLGAAFRTFDGILSAAEKGLGWVPGLGDKIKTARAAFTDFGDKTIAKLDKVEQKLRDAERAVNGLAKDRSATVTIHTVRTGSSVQHGGGHRDPDLPGRATGGPVVPGRAYLVGERGPEVFRPRVSGRVLPKVQRPTPLRVDGLADITDALGADEPPTQPRPRGTTTLRVPVYLDRRQIGEAVVDDLEDRLARA